MRLLLVIAMCVTACQGSGRQIRLTPSNSDANDATAQVPKKDVIVVRPTTAPADPKPPGNIEMPPTPPAPMTTIKDVDAKLPKDLSWVAATGGTTTPDSLAAGDSYICRAMHNGAYLPGEMVPLDSLCYVADNTVVIGYSTYQLLNLASDDVTAVLSTYQTTTGELPKNMMPLGLKGTDVQGVCLVSQGATVFIGRIDAKTGGCLYSDYLIPETVVTKFYSVVTFK